MLAAGQLGFGKRMVVAGNELVSDILVVEFHERLDIFVDDLRLILPSGEGKCGRGRSKGTSAHHACGSKGGSALQYLPSGHEKLF